LSIDEKYGKRRQITFRIGPIAEDKLRQVAALFNMKPSEYAKAVLYRDIGVFNEALDQRKRSWRQKQHQEEDFAEEPTEDEETKEFAGRHTSRT